MNTLLKKCLAATLLLGGLLSLAAFTPASAASSPDDLKGKNVVLVHGAFADGSSWDKVCTWWRCRIRSGRSTTTQRLRNG